MISFPEFLAQHPLFSEIPEHVAHTLSECATEARYPANAALLLGGAPADHFHFIREGNVALQLHPPHRGPVILQTLGSGDVLGWSWMLPPYTWHFDAIAQTDCATFRLDARCVRGKCDADPAIGYLLTRIFSVIMLERLMATRLQLLDLYAPPGDVRP